MTLADAFVEYLESITGSTLGQDLFVGQAPSSNSSLPNGDPVPDALWWVVTSGGAPDTKLISGEKVKSYLIEVNYRNRDGQTVAQEMHDLEEALNCSDCVELTGFETFEIDATTFPVDQDLDDEDRRVGLLQATIRIYKSC
jgi:hypothetical protein